MSLDGTSVTDAFDPSVCWFPVPDIQSFPSRLETQFHTNSSFDAEVNRGQSCRGAAPCVFTLRVGVLAFGGCDLSAGRRGRGRLQPGPSINTHFHYLFQFLQLKFMFCSNLCRHALVCSLEVSDLNLSDGRSAGCVRACVRALTS